MGDVEKGDGPFKILHNEIGGNPFFTFITFIIIWAIPVLFSIIVEMIWGLCSCLNQPFPVEGGHELFVKWRL